MLGLNPMEQEVVDIPNEIARLKYCRVIYCIQDFKVFFDLFLQYFIQHIFIGRRSESSVAEDAGIESRTVATIALSVRPARRLT